MKHCLWILLFLVFTVKAQSVDVRKLTSDQVRELQIKALQMEKEESTVGSVANISAVSRGEAQKWAELGQSVGRAMVAAAKEVGASVVEFSKTDIGRITTVIVVYKIIGRDILHIVIGVLLMILGPMLIFRIRNYICVTSISYEYQDRKFLWLDYKKKVVKSITKISGDEAFWTMFWTCVLTLLCFIGGTLIALN